MAILTDLDKFRLELGDTDTDRALFNDDEAGYFLDQRPGNVLLAVADACDSLARRYSRDVDVTTDGQQLLRSQKAKAYRDQADALRKRAGGGITTVTVTRVDGYSDDIDTREGGGGDSRTGRVLRGYSDPDLPV
jgi:hypothetical protein